MNQSRLVAPTLKFLVAANLALLISSAGAQTPAGEDLARKVDQLGDELTKVKEQLKQMQDEKAAGAATSAPASSATASASSVSPNEPATILFSYGEINYNRPTKHTEDTQVDLRRFVLGLQHRFDEKNKLVTEIEVEHAVSSADDPGEVEIEQAYVEHALNQTWSARGGLFLIPAGLLNERHEPTAYYGVERNFVETAIIPTTWREGGVEIVGNFDNGLTLQTGFATGFDLNKWDATSTEGLESPLGSIHQELALAKGHDISVFGALNWRGIPGLQLGASVFTGGATQGQATTDSRVTLWDLHARWTPGRWDLAALYARGSISNTAELNQPLVGNPTLIPESFDGWYAQAAYKLWEHQEYALTPFVRWEQFNTARSYADLGTGLTPEAAKTERVITVGANFQVSPGIVLKADVQRFRENDDANRFDLGLGWSF
jgi:hypothetical protein